MSSLDLESGTIRLFVYGTLLRGGCRHFLLRDQRLLGQARTQPRYLLYDFGEYPAMVEAAHGASVEGALYEVDASRLPELDAVEGAPTLFRLESVDLEGANPSAYAYLYQRSVEGWPRCERNRWVIEDSDSSNT